MSHTRTVWNFIYCRSPRLTQKALSTYIFLSKANSPQFLCFNLSKANSPQFLYFHLSKASSYQFLYGAAERINAMPKVSKLQTQVFYKGPSSRGKFAPYQLYTEWESRYLQYKKNFWKKLDFKKVVGWEAKAGGYVGSFMDAKQPPRIVLKTRWGEKNEEREFAFRHEEFDNWLYWIIRSVLKHSKAPLPEEKLALLSPNRKMKMITRRDMKAFDMSHMVFVAIKEGLDFALKEKKKAPSPPVRRGFHPDIVKGPKVSGRTQSGTAYSNVTGKIGQGGSHTLIWGINKLLEPILVKNTDGSFKELVRPAEPMVVKVPKLFDQKAFHDSYDSAYKSLVREARILAALGLHRNIVRLIDAHLVSKVRLYLFLEKGYHDLSRYKVGKGTKVEPLTPPTIRKYAMGILAGINHMHSRRIYHLDMKPENVIICKADTPKIIDFGLAKARVLDSKTKMFNEVWSQWGTNGYKAPERWIKDWCQKEIHLAKFDAFAVGMTILEVLLAPFCGWKAPPEIKGPFETLNQVHRRINHWLVQARKETVRKKLTQAGLLIVTDAACGLIDKNPAHRLTVEQALEFIRADALTSLKEFHYLKDQLKKSQH
jgi:serine/threonine protein kinase